MVYVTPCDKVLLRSYKSGCEVIAEVYCRLRLWITEKIQTGEGVEDMEYP